MNDNNLKLTKDGYLCLAHKEKSKPAQQDKTEIHLVESKEWAESLTKISNRDDLATMVDALDKNFAQAEKEPKIRKQLQNDFNNKLKEALIFLEKRKNVNHKVFAVLFDKIDQSSLLNMHMYPRVSAFFKLEKTTKKQAALGMIRHAALDIFNAKMERKFQEIKGSQSASKADEYQALEKEIRDVMHSALFASQRANWPGLKVEPHPETDSYRNIYNGIYDRVAREKRHELGQFSPPPSPGSP